VEDPRDGAWTSLGGYSSQTSYVLVRPVPGRYRVIAYAKAQGAPFSSAVVSAPAVITFTQIGAVCALEVSGPNVAQPVGSEATFTATATDPGGTPLYQFWVHSEAGWEQLGAYAKANQLTLSELAQGSYVVAVYALDEADIAAGRWDHAYFKVFILNVGSSVQLVGPDSGTVGTELELIALAEGLTGEEYQFWYRTPDGQWRQSGAYQTSKHFNFTPDQAGEYRVVVFAKDHYAPATDQFAVFAVKSITIS